MTRDHILSIKCTLKMPTFGFVHRLMPMSYFGGWCEGSCPSNESEVNLPRLRSNQPQTGEMRPFMPTTGQNIVDCRYPQDLRYHISSSSQAKRDLGTVLKAKCYGETQDALESLCLHHVYITTIGHVSVKRHPKRQQYHTVQVRHSSQEEMQAVPALAQAWCFADAHQCLLTCADIAAWCCSITCHRRVSVMYSIPQGRDYLETAGIFLQKPQQVSNLYLHYISPSLTQLKYFSSLFPLY